MRGTAFRLLLTDRVFYLSRILITLCSGNHFWYLDTICSYNTISIAI